MDVKKLLADVTALPGVSGHEAQVLSLIHI